MIVLAAWTDVGIFFATSAGVVVTVCAVLVALFGPGWDRRRRRPVVTLSTVYRSRSTRVSDTDPFCLRLHNKTGCETAREVEVFAEVTFPVEGGGLGVVAEQANLNFDNPTDDGPGRSTASVPAGFSRDVNLAVLDEAEFVDLDDTDDHERRRLRVAYLALYPKRLVRTAGLHENRTYEVGITVTGSNFDAVRYVGHLAFSDVISDGDINVVWNDFKPSG
jgi:hypothetical protein